MVGLITYCNVQRGSGTEDPNTKTHDSPAATDKACLRGGNQLQDNPYAEKKSTQQPAAFAAQVVIESSGRQGTDQLAQIDHRGHQ